MRYMNEQTAAAQLAARQAGRLASVTQNVVQLVAGDNALLSPSTKRHGVIIMPPSWGRAWVSIDVASQLGVGMVLDADGPPLILNADEFGDMVHRGFRAYHTMLDVSLAPMPAASRSGAIGTGANALASVVIPAVAGQCAIVEAGTAMYIPSSAGFVRVVISGVTVAYYSVLNSAFAILNRPVVGPVNTAVTITLDAGGAGIAGYITVDWTMVPAPTMTVYEVIGP